MRVDYTAWKGSDGSVGCYLASPEERPQLGCLGTVQAAKKALIFSNRS